MKEFMFFIRNRLNAKSALSAEDHLAFVKKCEVYIGKLKSEGKLTAAQPLLREGVLLSKIGGEWAETSVGGQAEIQAGYYHILAEDLAEAVRVAKKNPEFEYVPSASIEVRPVKMKEVETSFIYPKG